MDLTSISAHAMNLLGAVGSNEPPSTVSAAADSLIASIQAAMTGVDSLDVVQATKKSEEGEEGAVEVRDEEDEAKLAMAKQFKERLEAIK